MVVVIVVAKLMMMRHSSISFPYPGLIIETSPSIVVFLCLVEEPKVQHHLSTWFEIFHTTPQQQRQQQLPAIRPRVGQVRIDDRRKNFHPLIGFLLLDWKGWHVGTARNGWLLLFS